MIAPPRPTSYFLSLYIYGAISLKYLYYTSICIRPSSLLFRCTHVIIITNNAVLC